MDGGTRKLAVSALLLAADVVLTRLLAINTPVMKLGLGFAAAALCAMLYGPWQAALVAGLADLVGALLFPTGAYYPPFTLTAACTGVIFGLCLRRERPLPLTAAALNCVLVSYLANTALIARLSGAPYTELLAARAVQLLVMLPVQAVTLTLLTRSARIRAALSLGRGK